MNKAHKMMKEKSLIKEKKPSSWKIFNEWCRRRSNKQKIIICLLALLFVVTLPYNIFCLRTYVASWDLYWNSNLPYRIGEKISKKELEECFVQTNTKHYPFPEYGYQGESDVISALKTSRYPIPFLPSSQRVVSINTRRINYNLYEIEPGVDAAYAKEILIKHGYRYQEETSYMYEGERRRTRYYCKGVIMVEINDRDGIVSSASVRLWGFWG